MDVGTVDLCGIWHQGAGMRVQGEDRSETLARKGALLIWCLGWAVGAHPAGHPPRDSLTCVVPLKDGARVTGALPHGLRVSQRPQASPTSHRLAGWLRGFGKSPAGTQGGTACVRRKCSHGCH